MDDLLSSSDLVSLVEAVGRLSTRLNCSFHEAVSYLQRLSTGADAARAPRPVAAFVDRYRSIRLKRNAMMGANVFRDPAWDMMLDLFVYDSKNRHCSTSALCVGSGAPATTALRHIDRLDQAGLIVRTHDRRDHRRTLVELAPGLKERLEGVLDKIQDCY